MPKKLLIGIPGYAGIVPRCQESIIAMMYNLGRRTDLEVAVQIVIKKEQFRARNHLVNTALTGGFDYLLMLDDDMVVPHDLPVKLMSYNKDVIGALYYQRGGSYRPVVMTEQKPDEFGNIHFEFWSHNDQRIIENPGMHTTDVIGGGCMLFDTKVFKGMPQPYFEWEQTAGTDIAICQKIRKLGYTIWINTAIELGHVGDSEVITSRSIPLDRRILQEEAENIGKDLEAYYGMPTEWVKEQLAMAPSKEKRKLVWGDRKDTWEEVMSFYQEEPDWHIFNLSYFNITQTDPYRFWMLNEGNKLLDRGSFLDYGAGIGSVSIPLARNGNRVYAIDVENAGTLKFLNFRKNLLPNKDMLSIWQTRSEYPSFLLPELMDGACMISVLNHLTKPLEAVRWVRDQLKPGAFFVCDWILASAHEHGEEPQHLDRYDLSEFGPFMKSLGFVTSPEHQWLFFYQPVKEN